MTIRLTVHARPGARQERVALADDGTLAVWVRARPVEGQANRAIVLAVARALGLKQRQVTLIAGESARQKILAVDLPDADAVRSRLAP